MQRPTYRLLEDLRGHGLDLAQGTVTDGVQRLAPLFTPLYETLIERSRQAGARRRGGARARVRCLGQAVAYGRGLRYRGRYRVTRRYGRRRPNRT